MNNIKILMGLLAMTEKIPTWKFVALIVAFMFWVLLAYTPGGVALPDSLVSALSFAIGMAAATGGLWVVISALNRETIDILTASQNARTIVYMLIFMALSPLVLWGIGEALAGIAQVIQAAR